MERVPGKCRPEPSDDCAEDHAFLKPKRKKIAIRHSGLIFVDYSNAYNKYMSIFFERDAPSKTKKQESPRGSKKRMGFFQLIAILCLWKEKGKMGNEEHNKARAKAKQKAK